MTNRKFMFTIVNIRGTIKHTIQRKENTRPAMPKRYSKKVLAFLKEHEPERYRAIIQGVQQNHVHDPKIYSPEYLKRTDLHNLKALPVLASLYYYNYMLITHHQVLQQEQRERYLLQFFLTLYEIYALKGRKPDEIQTAELLAARHINPNRRQLAWYFKNYMEMQTNTVATILKTNKQTISRWMLEIKMGKSLNIVHPVLDTVIGARRSMW